MSDKPQITGKTILYLRVSTKSQELDMQVHCGERKADSIGVSKDDLIILTDHGVSARKTKLYQRPGLNEAMRLIATGQISTLITYDRCRIARNAPQYIQFLQLCMKHKVQILLSKSKVDPVTDDIANEARLALQAQRDGNLIAERSKDGQIYYPNPPLGYRRMGERGDKHYVQTPDIDKVVELYRGFNNVKNLTDYKMYELHWKTQGIDVPTTLSNLFYAAYTTKNNEPEPLTHVTGIVDLETVLNNRKKLSELGIWTDTKVTYYPTHYPEIPVNCGVCGALLVPKHRKGKSMYRCNHGNSRSSRTSVVVEVEKVDKAFEDGLEDLMQRFSHHKVQSTAQAYITHLLFCFSEMFEQENLKLTEARQKLLRCSGGVASIYSVLQECMDASNRIDEIKQKQFEIERLRSNILDLREQVVHSLASGVRQRVHELAQLFEIHIVLEPKLLKLVHKGAEYFHFKEAQ